MPSRSVVARGSARVASGIIALSIGVVAIAGATWFPLPGFSATAPAQTVVPVPTTQQRVCPGPLLALAANSSEATAVSSFGLPDFEYGSGPADAAPAVVPLKSLDDTAAGQFGSPVRVTVPASSDVQRIPKLAASQAQLAAQDDLTGLAAASCAEPSPDSWLVGGSSTLGETTLVILTNPSSVEATVDLTIYGEAGRLNAPGSTGIEVAPGTQRVVPLAGLAPSVAAPVVHVQTTGGQVLASLQQSDISGITPLGAELIGTTAGPATHQIIVGMAVRTLAVLQAEQSGDAYPENLPAARILVPGPKPATVRIGVTGEAGTASGNSVSQTIQPGVVTEVPLDHLADGDFTVTVDSDQPVVVAARTTTQTKSATDFGWFVASQRLPESFLVAVAKGPQATLHLANTGTGSSAVTVTSPVGRIQHVTIPSGAAAGVPVTARGLYVVSATQPVLGSVSYAGPGQLSSFAINPPAPLAAPIRVYPK